MIYTVTLNPSLDYVVDLDKLELGTLNRTNSEHIYPGGKGINVSIVLKNLGIRNTALGLVAGFTGLELQRQLEMLGIDTNLIMLSDGISRINFKFRSKDTEQTTEVNQKGPVVHSGDIDHLYKLLDVAKKDDILVLSGSLPTGLPDTIYEDIVAKTVSNGVIVIVDSGKKVFETTLKYHPFLIKPNRGELGAVFGVQIKTVDDAVLYGRKCQEMGARNILVSMGGDGAVLITEDGRVLVEKAPKAPEGVHATNVGAGDAMIAGFVAALKVRGIDDLEYALKASVACGSASAFSSHFPKKKDILEILETM